MELGLPCIGEPPYYLVQRIAARNLTLGARAAVYRGAAVLFGTEEGAARNPPLELGRREWRREEKEEKRRRSGPHRRNLATPTPEGGEQNEHRSHFGSSFPFWLKGRTWMMCSIRRVVCEGCSMIRQHDIGESV